MRKAIEYAKYFIKENSDFAKNSIDGNMKLQKLLFFATLISLAERQDLLFEEDIYAFKNGCVIEPVRLRYKNNYSSLLNDSKNYDPDFTEEEYEILNKTIAIFGDSTAKELSELNHSFDCWKNAYEQSGSEEWHDKEMSIVTKERMLSEISKIDNVLEAYYETKNSCEETETINGINFHFNPKETNMDEDLINLLSDISLDMDCDDEKDYSINYDEGRLVIY